MPFKDKEKRKAYVKEWQRNNPDKMKESYYRYQENHPVKKLLKAAKHNAKTRGLEFSISDEDIIIPEKCPYLDIVLTFQVQQCNSPSTISLDRIDNSKGYVKGNVQVISRLANLMKSYASEDQLKVFARNVLKIHEISTK